MEHKTEKVFVFVAKVKLW